MRTIPLALLVLVVVPSLSNAQTAGLHPLDPLTRAEMTATVEILKAAGKVETGTRFAIIAVNEPPKDYVLALRPGDPPRREAFAVMYHYADNRTAEAVVDLIGRRVVSWRVVPGVQPPALIDDVKLTTELVQADPRWQEAVKKRGITDLSRTSVFPYPSGSFVSAGDGERDQGRLILGITEFSGGRDDPREGRVGGLAALVNLTTRKVIRLIDSGDREVFPSSREYYEADSNRAYRESLKPLRLNQPSGPSFTLTGHEVRWDRWRFRFGMHPREGLVLYLVQYEDAGRARPVLYRGALSELFVPYGDPGRGGIYLNAFDLGEAGGVGIYGSVALTPGDCPENAVFVGATMHDYDGNPVDVPRATCLFERDGGVLWRHGADVHRARDLVLSSIARVDNYDYGFNWIFHQDGSLEMEVLLTGIMNTEPELSAHADGSIAGRYETKVGQHIAAMNHQHLFNFRLDLDVDGSPNTVREENTEPPPLGPLNPEGNAGLTRETVFRREQDARRDVNLISHRRWRVVNSSSMNAHGEPTAYTLVPGENALPFAAPSSPLRVRAGFSTAHLWVTPYQADERYAAGDYVSQNRSGDGLPRWTSQNRGIERTDVVLWYTMGITHVPRPEDWPVMPAHRAGFKLVPSGFFDRNPALDVR